MGKFIRRANITRGINTWVGRLEAVIDLHSLSGIKIHPDGLQVHPFNVGRAAYSEEDGIKAESLTLFVFFNLKHFVAPTVPLHPR